MFNRKTFPVASDETPIWYFAYGSNMSHDKFSNHRGIHPLASARVLLPGWKLTFQVPGMPYNEPGMSSIAPINTTHKSLAHASSALTSHDPENSAEAPVIVHGRAYLITPSQLVQIVKSEGGGIAYKIKKLPGEAVGPEDEALLGGNHIDIFALVNVPAMSRSNPGPLPSKRYKRLLLEGATEAAMPEAYIEFLRAWPQYDERWRDESGTRGIGREVRQDCEASGGYSVLEKGGIYGAMAVEGNNMSMSKSKLNLGAKLGALIFLAIFSPLLSAMEKLCYMCIRPTDGECPHWVKTVVRWAVWWIWLSHDIGFAPIFGPGDGRDQGHDSPAGIGGYQDGLGEASPLLPCKVCGQREISVVEHAEDSIYGGRQQLVFWSR